MHPISEFDPKAFLRNLTKQPGVYQMYDAKGEILYVGKAKNLKNRVSSYFRQSGLSGKTEALVKRIVNIEVTVAPSEAEALVLEQNLIKAQKPPFNILLRDDKSYPYIYLSDGERHPRLSFHRGSKKKKGQYFGPYPSASAVRETLGFLQKTFGLRQCEDSVYKNRMRPCLLFQIGRCSGPCVEKISDEEYARDIEHTAMFLNGKSEHLHQILVGQMEASAENMEYERAAVFRDRISALRQVQASRITEAGYSNFDVIACVREAAVACIHVLFVRQGKVMGSKSYFPKDKLENNECDTLSAFVAHFYLGGSSMDIPGNILLSHELEDAQVLAEAIQKVANKVVNISHKVRTYKASWLAMALEAARQNLRAQLNSKQTLLQRYESLQELLELDELPMRMECFDISHSSGELTVASCVVFDQNGARKSDYRRFNIEGITGGDDYAAMEQAIQRRYTRMQKEAQRLPDLLLIDGGKGQLGKAAAVLNELGVDSIEIVGVAKGTTRKAGFEKLIFPDGREFALASDTPGLHLIQQIRDEAHRFAITGHKQRRDKKRVTSTLEGIPGIGPKRRRELLKYFGGLQEVINASVEDLAKVPNLSKKMAQEVYSVLHSE